MEEQEITIQETPEKQSFWEKLAVVIKSKVFLINVGISLLVVVLIFMSTFYGLNLLTHHGESLSVPDFRGMSIKQVKKVAADHDLKIKVIDSVYNAPGKIGSVAAQIPPPDFKVKEGRTILLTIKIKPKKIKMPDLTNISLIQAKADMEIYGFKIGKISYKPDVATDDVLEQWYQGKPIEPGTPIETGATIDLVLGLGDEGQISTVPYLIGKTKQEAENLCFQNSYEIGVLLYDESIISHTDSLNAKVWKQSPDPDSRLTVGSQIDLWLTVDINKLETNN